MLILILIHVHSSACKQGAVDPGSTSERHLLRQQLYMRDALVNAH